MKEVRAVGAILKMAENMIQKANAERCQSKGSWEGVGLTDLFYSLKEEVDELEEEIHSYELRHETKRFGTLDDYERIIQEATDVALYAAFIADVASKKKTALREAIREVSGG